MKHHIPRYSCSRGWMDNGEPRCIAFGGLRVDDAIEEALLGVVGPGAIAAAVEAEAKPASGATRCATRCCATSKRRVTRPIGHSGNTTPPIPANRLVAGELEVRWNKALARVGEVESKIAAHDAADAGTIADPASLTALATDLKLSGRRRRPMRG